jgi:hypothetical protein
VVFRHSVSELYGQRLYITIEMTRLIKSPAACLCVQFNLSSLGGDYEVRYLPECTAVQSHTRPVPPSSGWRSKPSNRHALLAANFLLVSPLAYYSTSKTHAAGSSETEMGSTRHILKQRDGTLSVDNKSVEGGAITRRG